MEECVAGRETADAKEWSDLSELYVWGGEHKECNVEAGDTL